MGTAAAAATTTGITGKPLTNRGCLGAGAGAEGRDGTGNSKHLVKRENAKKKAEERTYRKDQEGGSEALKKRLGADVEEIENSIFDTCSNEPRTTGACST
jgi:hypothetical protein